VTEAKNKKNKMTYSQSVSLQKNQVYRRGANTYSLARTRPSLGPISTAVIVIALIALMGMLYLTQVTKTNSLGYKVSSLRSRESQLQREKDDLDIEAVRLQSIERVKSSQVANAMTTIKPSAYAN
jgi:cell division protein FtsL